MLLPLHSPVTGLADRARRILTPGALADGLGAAARATARSLGVRRPRLLRGPRLERPFDAPVLRTERLVLRPHREADAGAWFALESDAAVRRGVGWPDRDEAAIRDHFRDRTRHTRLEQAGDFLALGVEFDGRLIGDVSMHVRGVHEAARVIEIGWIVAPSHAGRGFATEAATEMLRVAFERLGAITVTAVIAPSNRPSIRLAERLGFELAGSCTGRLVYARTAARQLTSAFDGLALTAATQPSVAAA